MEETEAYQKFQKFLSEFLIRKAKDELSDHDFAEENFEYLRPHFEGLLPTLNLTDLNRLHAYINDVLVHHLTGEVEIIAPASRTSFSPIQNFNETERQSSDSQIPELLTDVFNEEEQMPSEIQGITAITDEHGTQSSPPKRLRTQIQSEEISEPLHSQSTNQTCVPLDVQITTQMTRTAPLMQSTPLSVPLADGEQCPLKMTQEDDFIAYILSQINLSPIPQMTEDHLIQEPIATSEVTFIKEFPNISRRTNERKRADVTWSRRKRLDQERPTEAILKQAVPKMKNIDFDTICSINKTLPDNYTKKAEESLLYFAGKPGKMKNMTKRVTNNVVIPEGVSGHISISRRTNLSNIIRAHVSQRQSSIEQVQMSLRSPCTPQALLRTSQLEPFTPIRGEVLTHSSMMELDFMSSIPMRPLLRQQPLITIPERDSTIPIPLTPQPGDLELNNILDGMTIPTDDVLTLPLEVGGNNSSFNIPNTVPEDVEMVQVQPPILNRTISNSNIVDAMQVEISRMMDPVHQNVVAFENDITTHQNVVGSNDNVPQNEELLDGDVFRVNQTQGVTPFSWFEVLRPRGEVAYPKVGCVRRRKKTNKRRIEREDVQEPQIHVLPEIPMNPEQCDMASVPDEISAQVTQIHVQTERIEAEFDGYFSFIKNAGKIRNCRTWEHFDPYAFIETHSFKILTHLFKRMLKDDMVYMDNLFNDGTSRLEAAKGFKLILELKTMGLIEIEAINSRIVGFKFSAVLYSS